MSAFSTFISTLAGMSVSDGSTAYTAKYQSTLRQAVPSMECPYRFITPFDDDAAHDGELLNKTRVRTDFTLTDLMLYAPYGEGYGWAQYASALDTYVGNWVDAIRDRMAAFCAAGAQGVTYSIRRTVISYAGENYYGVRATVTIREFN